MKRVLVAVLTVLVGVAVGVLVHRRWVAIEAADTHGALRLHGNVDVRDAALAFPDEERIAVVLVDEGDRVVPGQRLAAQRSERLEARIASSTARVAAQEATLARLVNGTRAQELEQARAHVAAAEAHAANTARTIERLETTSESGGTSAQDLDDARAERDVADADLRVAREALALAVEGSRGEDVDEARATLEALRADLALLHRRLADAVLEAPSAGVIQSRILEPGEIASPGRPVLILALVDPKWVRAWVPEPDLGRIAEGMRATVRTDAFGGRTFAGRVGFVSPVAEFTPKSVETDELRTRLVYEVRVLVEDPQDELRLGMPATVDVEAREAPADEERR